MGSPPISNHDDSLRAALTGINLIQELQNYKSEKWGIFGGKNRYFKKKNIFFLDYAEILVIEENIQF